MSLFLLQGRGIPGYFVIMGLMLLKSTVLLTFPFLAQSIAIGAEPSTLKTASQLQNWPEVHAQYQQGRFNEALQLLKKIAPQQIDEANRATYYFNLGTLSYRVGDLGKAVAFLEKANRLASNNSQVQHNLSLARSAWGKSIGADRLDPGASLADWWIDRTRSPKAQALFALFTFAILLMAMRRYSNLRSRSIRDIYTDSNIVLFCSLGIILFFMLLATTQFAGLLGTRPAAISLNRQTVKTGPGERFLELTQVETGTQVRLTGISVIEKIENGQSTLWYQVRLSQDGIGWIREADFLFL